MSERRRVAGCDIGKASARFALGSLDADGRLRLDATEAVTHEGKPLEVFASWYERSGIASFDALGATGIGAEMLTAPAIAGLPEDACLEAALALLELGDGPLNLVRVGARGYSVMSRSDDGRYHFLQNDKCSSGTGETMVKIAGRFGLGIEEADALALSAGAAIPITARCSVFAKSEMTHFGNQGKPAAELFRGYFDAIAGFAAALLARTRVPGPVLLVGGGSRLGALGAGLERALGQAVIVPEHAQCLEAIGALALAAEHSPAALPPDPEQLVRRREARFRVLEPPARARARVQRLEAAEVPEALMQEPSLLGLDLGSTGSKAVLTSLASGEPVLSVYDRTRGNPVDAAQRLVRAVLDATTPDVRAVGVTGSGREAVATVLRAAYPELSDRIVVVNEIVAHATAAIRSDEAGGESLSVVEIGGQDAKFIQIAGGQIVESDMNKACSAGTGSFLEEQAAFYGIDAIEEFTELAERAERPPDLGQMCTVFVADAAAEAHGEGFELPDLFGGFQYSVIHNYKNRVMGQRSFGRRIFFQGKPASSPSLAWALAEVADRDVIVPADPGAMGAWGIGLVALDELDAAQLRDAPAFDLDVVCRASVVGRKELRCHDNQCQTLCTIDKTTVAVSGETHSVLSGGACPKYEIPSRSRKLPKEVPDAFEERERALAPYLLAADAGDAPVVGVPLVGACFGMLPWLSTLLREVGLSTRVLRSGPASLARGEERCSSFDACAPAKIVHGVLDTDVDAVFFPKLLTLPHRDGPGGASCPMEQALPEMVRESLGARGRSVRIVHPELSLGSGLSSPALVLQLFAAIRELGGDPARLPAALEAARRAQQAYEDELERIGRRCLAYAALNEIPVVALCGALHVIHDPAVNAGVPRLLREGGALPLPMDCYPIPDGVHPLPRVGWADANRALRTAIAARARGGVYPLMLTAFGCGPASFGEQIFTALMAGYPHTVLESDGHGGAAGYVTRVQAFLHTVDQHDRRPEPIGPARLRLLEPLEKPPLEQERSSRFVMFAFADHISPILAAAYRSFGYDAVPADAPDAESLTLGRRDCSGKECLPYQLIWGSFRKDLERTPPDRRTVLVQVSGDAKCRNCLFSVKDQLSVERMGLSHTVALRHFGTDEQLGPAVTYKVWTGMTLWDLVFQLASYYRPLEKHPGSVTRLYDEFCAEVERWTARPLGSGLRAPFAMKRAADDALDFVDRASSAFRAAVRDEHDAARLGTVLLSGDIYVRIDGFSNGGLVERLNERGLKVLAEPSWTLSEYMAEERLPELLGLPTGFFRNAVTKAAMKTIRQKLYARARRLHPWLSNVESSEILAAADPLLHRHPQGEAPVTLGSVLHAWKNQACDGVVVASPWGYAPALVTESLLRSQRDIPMLFLYADGSPMDTRRLDAFAFKLHRARRAGRDSYSLRSSSTDSSNTTRFAPGFQRRTARSV